MRLFVDTSVCLAASGSTLGAARMIWERARANGWQLVVTPYVLEETTRNLSKLRPAAVQDWERLQGVLEVCEDVMTVSWPVVGVPAKDRPILMSAYAWADVLLTHDRRDFADMIGSEFYGMMVTSPGRFLATMRGLGRLV